jgi:hypothetical protein
MILILGLSTSSNITRKRWPAAYINTEIFYFLKERRKKRQITQGKAMK